MGRPERRAITLFWVQVAMLLTACLLPVPGVADVYATGFAATMNPILAAASHGSPVGLRFEAPKYIRVRGPWTVPLSMEARESREIVTVAFDVRSVSYRPITTFLIFALSSPFEDRRRKAVVLGLGLPLVWLITVLLMALPIANTLAGAGILGGNATRTAVGTACWALETPVMTYFIPILVWWLLLGRTRAAPTHGLEKREALPEASR